MCTENLFDFLWPNHQNHVCPSAHVYARANEWVREWVRELYSMYTHTQTPSIITLCICILIHTPFNMPSSWISLESYSISTSTLPLNKWYGFATVTCLFTRLLLPLSERNSTYINAKLYLRKYGITRIHCYEWEQLSRFEFNSYHFWDSLIMLLKYYINTNLSQSVVHLKWNSTWYEIKFSLHKFMVLHFNINNFNLSHLSKWS